MKISTTTHLFAQWFGEEEAIVHLKRNGFDALDLSMFFERHNSILDKPVGDVIAHYRSLKATADREGIAFSQTHAPFPTYVGQAAEDQYLEELIPKAIAVTGVVEAPYIVIHPLMPGGCIYAQKHEEAIALDLAFFEKMLPYLRAYNVRVAIENMFGYDPQTQRRCPTTPSTAAQMNEIIDALNDMAQEERFVACLDTGHMNIVGEDQAQAVRTLGKRLHVLHIHDNGGVYDDHTLPQLSDTKEKMCVTRWEPFTAALKEIGYPGTISLESDSFLAAYGQFIADDASRMMAAVARRLAQMSR